MPIKLIPEEIREYLKYNPDTGLLTWIKKPSNHIQVGDSAGTAKKYPGYMVVKFQKTSYFAHRIIWFLVTGNQPNKHIDHKNGDKLCNIWTNLREATISQNGSNSKRYRTNTSGVKGVTFHKSNGKWQAQITVNGKRIYLGSFIELKDAEEAYQSAANKYHEDFANYG